jgi:plasmid stabilization system protein ParE
VTPHGDSWLVVISDAAEADFGHIILWTEGRFGTEQSRRYAEAIRAALGRLSQGPSAIGVKPNADIAREIYSLHVDRLHRRARHVVFFRVSGEREIEIIRILHDGMDFTQHLIAGEPGET